MVPPAPHVTEQEPSFGDLLRRHRAAGGLSQEALSARSTISVDAISMLERGVRSAPRNSTVALLADALRLRSPERDAFLAAASRRAGSPGPAWMRPLDPDVDGMPGLAPHFVGREAELVELRRALAQTGRLVVHGPSGVGKTQLALRYVDAHGAEYPDGLFWLRAAGEVALVGALAGLAWRLGLPERDQPDLERQVESVVGWLRQRRRWLLVLDDLEPAAASAARRWLSSGLLGHVLETAPDPTSPTRLRLEPLPPEQRTRLLLRAAGCSDGEAAGALAERLGGLPLSLALAASHARARGWDLGAYAASLPAGAPEAAADDHSSEVAAAVRLSLGRLDVESPPAAAVLRLCAFLAPDDVALDLFGPGGDPDRLTAVPADATSLDRALSALERYALVERRTGCLRVHPLVQAAVRGALEPDAWEHWLAAAVRLLRARFPGEAAIQTERWHDCARLLAHVMAVDRMIGERAIEPRALGWLLGQAASYLQARGALGLARPVLERALAVQDRALGPEHPDTATSLNRLALLLHEQGELAAARPVLRRAVVLALGTSTVSPQVRDVLSAGLASMLGAEVDRIYGSRAEALSDMVRDLRIAVYVRLLASSGGDLQGETFEHLLFKRTPDRAVTFRVLLPLTRGFAAETHWMQARETEVGRFDPSFGCGMLGLQVEANIRFLRPYVEIGAVELRQYNAPHLARVLLTESVGYLTMYRADAHARDSTVVRYRRGATYEWLSRFYDMVWESASEPEHVWQAGDG